MTSPFFGVGNLYSLNEFMPYWCILSDANSVARFTMVIASNGQTFTHIPHPLQSSSSICAFFISSLSTIQSAPDLFTGQYLMHSNPHFFGWQSSLSNTATRWVINLFKQTLIYTSWVCMWRNNISFYITKFTCSYLNTEEKKINKSSRS